MRFMRISRSRPGGQSEHRSTPPSKSWIAAGRLKVEEDVIDSLEKTPLALIGLLAGENRGKRMVKVA
jgi:hypothetical protein